MERDVEEKTHQKLLTELEDHKDEIKFNDQDMFVTQVTNARQFLDIQIEGVRHVKESMFKQKVTYYTIKTKSTINGLYESGKDYRVDRRFNDFK